MTWAWFAGEVGNVWSFNFFFYNRKQKRILYFACRGKTHAAASSSGEESSECAYNSDAEVCTSSQLTSQSPRSVGGRCEPDDAMRPLSACEMGYIWMCESESRAPGRLLHLAGEGKHSKLGHAMSSAEYAGRPLPNREWHDPVWRHHRHDGPVRAYSSARDSLLAPCVCMLSSCSSGLHP